MNIVTLQSSFEECLNENEKFWVAIRRYDDLQKLFYVDSLNNSIGFKKNGNLYQFVYDNEIINIVNGQYFEFKDISSIGKLGANLIIGTNKGSLAIYNLETRETQIFAECHYLDIEQIQIFPSQEVILTKGLDHQIKLWSVKNWCNIRTMQLGFSTNVELIGKGRNFVVGNNNVVEMWECGQGQLIYKFSKVKNKDDRVMCLKVVEESGTQVVSANTNPHEYEIDNKTMFVGYNSGELRKFDLKSKNQEFVVDFNKPILQINAIGETLIIALQGELVLYHKQLKQVKLRKTFNPDIVKFVVMADHIVIYNGEDTLIKFTIDFKNYEIKNPQYLTGCPELFKVCDMCLSSDELVVGVDSGIARYKMK